MRASLKQISGPRPRPRRPGWSGGSGLALAGWLGLAAGCGREDIRVYEAPKDQPAAAEARSLPELGQPAAAARPPLVWQLPPGWEERPATAIRVGHFVIPGPGNQEAEVTVIPLAGTGGSDLDNVNRWRAQVNLPAITAEQLSRLAVSVPIGGFEGQSYDLVGDSYEADDQRTLAAILRREGTAWFFKMTGPAQLVGDQKGAFLEFLRTLRFGGASAGTGTAAAVASPAPPAAAAAPAASAASAASGDAGLPRWQVPEHWESQAPGAMQAVRFVPRDAVGRAEVSVAMLPGDGGGRLANVNRWRRQLGLGPISEADLPAAVQPLPAGGAAGYWVDLPAPESGRRLVAAAVQVGDRSWFYKLTGEAAVVEREKPVFLQFVQTAAYAP